MKETRDKSEIIELDPTEIGQTENWGKKKQAL
jgi:hypothetical protein